VSELKRNVAASYKNNPLRKLFQLQKLIASNQMTLAGYGQLCRMCPRGNDHVPGIQRVISHLDRSLIYEMGSTVERGDPSLCKPLLCAFRNRLRERSLKTH